MKLILLLLLFNLLFSQTELKLFKKISQFTEKDFFGKTNKILEYKSKYYLADFANGYITVLNKDFEYVRKIGRPGSGPGEFKQLYEMNIHNDTIYAHSESNFQIHSFTLDGKYISTYKLPLFPRIGFVMDKDKNYYLASTNTKHPITKVDKNMNINKTFGNWYNYEKNNEMENRFATPFSLVNYKNKYIIALNQAYCYLDFYTLDGKFYKKIDLLNIKELKVLKKRFNKFEEYLKEKRKDKQGGVDTFITSFNLFDENVVFSFINVDNKRIIYIVLYNLKTNKIDNIYTHTLSMDNIVLLSSIIINKSYIIMNDDYNNELLVFKK